MSCCPFFYHDVNNAGSVCVFIGDNMLTAVSVARDCGIIPLGQRVVVAHGLSGYSGEPTQLLYTNANNNMPSPLSAVSFPTAATFQFLFSLFSVFLMLEHRWTISVFDQAFSNINKQKSNEMHLDCLLYHLIPPTCCLFGVRIAHQTDNTATNKAHFHISLYIMTFY